MTGEWGAALSWLRTQIDASEAAVDSVHDADCDNAIARGYDSCACGWPGRLRLATESDRRILAEIVPLIDEMDDRIRGEWSLSTDPYEAPESRKLVRLLALPLAGLPDFPTILRLEPEERVAG